MASVVWDILHAGSDCCKCFFGAKLSFAEHGKRRGLPRCPLSLRSVLEVVNPGRRGREINGERQGEAPPLKAEPCLSLEVIGAETENMPAWRRKVILARAIDLV